jgi:hypothetical protein
MKTQRLLIVLAMVNIALLALTLLSIHATVAHGAQDTVPVLRARALEIVDEQGRVRASIGVLPATTSPNGARSRETVLLRLITERGRPSVKLGASEESAGMSLAGPTGTSNTYVILQAKNTRSELKLRNENGREKVLAP